MIHAIYNSLINSPKSHRVILMVCVVLLYGNTLLNNFAVDDSIVIVKNEYVKKGLKGIPDLLNKDTFRGFFKVEGKDKLVSGGRYRPLSLVLFAIVYEFFGSTPFIFHLMTIGLFALLCLMMYNVLQKLLEEKWKAESYVLAFMASLIFTIHPIHTECIANIKGCDEILALLLSLTCFWFILQWLSSRSYSNILFACVFLTLALFSKENSISFLILIPLGVYFFKNKGIQKPISIFLILIIPTLFFLYCRAQILGWNPIAGKSYELMNNPFLKYVNGQYLEFTSNEKLGTIFYTLIRYVGLLFFPHPLTYDYYPKHISMQNLYSTYSILSLLFYGFLIFTCLKFWNKNSLISFSILAYLIPLSIVSNLVFSVGTFMGERFLFMPSLGFSLLMAYLFWKMLQQYKTTATYALLAIFILSSIKTISRNTDWKDDYTLILHDVNISPRSAKINTAVGGIVLEKINDSTIDKDKIEKIKLAKKHLNRAIEIHPMYFEAYKLLGNAHFLAKEYKEAIVKYEFILKYRADDEDARNNAALSYRELGRISGMNENNPALAVEYLKKSMEYNSKDQETIKLMGVAHGVLGLYDKAIEIFSSLLTTNPNSADAYLNLYLTYNNKGDKIKAEECLEKAKAIDPNILNKFNSIH